MTKRALIIGSQTGGLSGVHHDVQAMDELLNGRGFATTTCIKERARRDEILEAYEKLIVDTQAGDTAVVYYSGHGGLANNPHYRPVAEAGQPLPRHYQFIVPYDINESTDYDFRGITSLELSLHLARLTEKTRNVTLILDCCHAARMSRDITLVPKALSKKWLVGIEAHLAKLSAQGIATDLLDVESNPHAVRLVAASPTQSAFEYHPFDGPPTGILTESLVKTLAETNDLPVSWHSLGTRIRQRTLAIASNQRPEVEGPTDRLLFSLETVDLRGVLPVISHGGKPKLQGGRLHGVHVGDVYAIASLGVEKNTPDNTIAEAVVTGVDGTVSNITVKFEPGHSTVPEGANAFPMSTGLPRQAVIVDTPDDEHGRRLRDLIEQSERLRVVTSEVQDAVLAHVVIENGQIILRDRSNTYTLVNPKPLDEEGIKLTVWNLNQYARVQTLLNVGGGEGAEALDNDYEIEFGRVVDGQPHPFNLIEDDVALGVGDRLYLRVKNNGPEKLYVSIFDIAPCGKISLMTRSEPSGIELSAGEEYVFGYREGKGLRGIGLDWSDVVPKDGPRLESAFVFLMDRPQDLRSLEGTGMRGIVRSTLIDTVEQIGLGGTRMMRDDDDKEAVSYAVSRVDFLLYPEPLPEQDESNFLIDHRPSRSLLVLAPRSTELPPNQVAIRLNELIVHNNRALLSTEVRVDNMIITGPPKDDEERFYQAATARFSRIKNGDRLPLDNMLVYHGPVNQFIDMAVWVSRNQEDSLTLADLFKTEMNSTEFKTAAMAVAALAVAAPQAAIVTAAVGGAATLIQIGSKLLLQAAGKSIGLYRTSFLPLEKFGIGRHPVSGVMRAQDFSFSYEVLRID